MEGRSIKVRVERGTGKGGREESKPSWYFVGYALPSLVKEGNDE